MLHLLKPHEVTPHSRMIALVLFLAVVPVLSFYTGMQYTETVRVVGDEAITLTLVPVRPSQVTEPGMREYVGTYFTAQYPESFTLVATGTDEVLVTSEDGRASFYAFAPQWIGEPAYLSLREGEEVMIDETQDYVDVDPDVLYPVIKTRLIMYRALDGSYTRSLISEKRGFTESDTVTHRVFGLEYADESAYDEYLDAYLLFTESLKHYRE